MVSYKTDCDIKIMAKSFGSYKQFQDTVKDLKSEIIYNITWYIDPFIEISMNISPLEKKRINTA